jgi:SAM-dependent methyltransferase
MVDHAFADAHLAEFYDVLNQDRDDFDSYLPLIMSAAAVLDVGCGTGALLHRARRAGHPGRLCGLDPAAGMLAQAGKRSDIEWVLGDLGSVSWEQEFDLVVMTGHAFQVLVEDDELRASLTAIRAALTAAGRFVFETRNPLARAWERWTPDHPIEATAASGAPVRVEYQVETPVEGDIVSFTHTFTSPSLAGPHHSRSTLRFLDTTTLSGYLSDAGLTIDHQFGDWTGGPLTDASPEIITFARRS